MGKTTFCPVFFKVGERMRKTLAWCLVAAAVAALSGCGSGDKGRDGGVVLVKSDAEVVYTDGNAEFPHIRYGDGLESLNDRCMVRHSKLNLHMRPLYVNGRPAGFC